MVMVTPILPTLTMTAIRLIRLSTTAATLIQTQIARGRIFDADAASEASRLAKQQILAGAATQMISVASAQKRSLVDMLI